MCCSRTGSTVSSAAAGHNAVSDGTPGIRISSYFRAHYPAIWSSSVALCSDPTGAVT
jgi:hypothetical protein